MLRSDPTLPIDSSQSIFLLGGPSKDSQASFLEPYRKVMAALASQGEFLSHDTTPEWLSCYERDAQSLQQKLPLLVFRPHTIAGIAPLIRLCYELDLPVSVRSGGTGLAGGCVVSTGGVIVLTGHFKKLTDYDPQKGTLSAQPGVTVQQLNRHVESDGWIFPLSMTTEGVAGLSGCLSTHARGYHQQGKCLYSAIVSAVCVDGRGETIEVPSALLCGSEGLWGVITGMKVKLKRKHHARMEFISPADWNTVLQQLDALFSLESLADLLWCEGTFYIGLEGEAWRLPGSAAALKKIMPGIEPAQLNIPRFTPMQTPYIAVSSALPPSGLPEAVQFAQDIAQQLGLKACLQADVLAGSLQFRLQGEESLPSFRQKVEQFLVLWADYLDAHQGMIGSCHGVGIVLAPYMTPFWREETLRLWRELQEVFDPGRLFSRERFFPSDGKSLEKCHGSD